MTNPSYETTMTNPNHETTAPTDETTDQNDGTTGDASITSRRDVLKATGASVVGLTASDTAGAATPAGGPVEFNVGFAAESGRNAALSRADAVVRKFDSLDVVTIRAPTQAADALESRSDVRYVEENGRMEALAQTIPWGIDRVDADSETAEGNGAHVAIIDTGIDSDHPDLEANLGEGAAAVPCNPWYADCDPEWDDDNGHGTHCAGIVAAVDNTIGVLGVGSQITLHAVKVLDSRGSGSYSDIAAGIEYVADQGWDVGSLSLGGSASSSVRDAVQYANNRGVTLVAAAGNSGSCTDCVGYPAAYPETIAVSSTNSNDDLSSFSSTGPEVDIAAPGSDIYSTLPDGDYGFQTGTSAAAPHVSGAAGILRAQGYTNYGAKDRLKNTAEYLPGLSSNEQGHGLLDVERAA